MVAGLTVEEATLALQQRFQLATPPNITISPNWLGRLPYFPTRIKVEVYQSPDAVQAVDRSPFDALTEKLKP